MTNRFAYTLPNRCVCACIFVHFADNRDIVVAYWSRLYALQTGLKLSSKQPEETAVFLALMEWLETTKKAHHDNEAILHEVVAQAHIENYALKLFTFADQQDRASNFNK